MVKYSKIKWLHFLFISFKRRAYKHRKCSQKQGLRGIGVSNLNLLLTKNVELLSYARATS
ncbi:MAG: hypothetical protein CMP67_08205 [Flavobacteriales bacterium]|nr:hypothetical protein [Flavobacteriales bacterium]